MAQPITVTVPPGGGQSISEVPPPLVDSPLPLNLRLESSLCQSGYRDVMIAMKTVILLSTGCHDAHSTPGVQFNLRYVSNPPESMSSPLRGVIGVIWQHVQHFRLVFSLAPGRADLHVVRGGGLLPRIVPQTYRGPLPIMHHGSIGLP